MKHLYAVAIIFLFSTYLFSQEIDTEPVEISSPEDVVSEETVVESSAETIVLEKSGAQGDYSVYMDGLLIGTNLDEIPLSGPGTYHLEIRQQRVTRESIFFSENISVAPGERAVVSFNIPDLLRSETRAILQMKRDVERGLRNNDSLFELRTELNEFLLQMPDWMEDKAILSDYALKIQIEIERRKTETDLIYGDPVDLAWFLEERDFSDYKSDTTTGEVDFSRALKFALILKRLEMIRPLIKKDFAAYLEQRDYYESIRSLSARVSPEFDSQYTSDFNFLNGMYIHYIEGRKIPNKKTFLKQVENYYSEIWNTFQKVEKGDIYLNSREVLALKASWSSLSPPEVWSLDALPHLEKKLKFNAYVGGGAMATTGIFWQPLKWLALQAGVSGAYDFIEHSEDYPELSDDNPKLSVALPIELNFFIVDKKWELFLGLTADMIRVQEKESYHWSIGGDSSETSNFAFWTSFGFNLGFGMDLGRFDVYLNNYIHFPGDMSDGPSSIRYSPAIGVRF